MLPAPATDVEFPGHATHALAFAAPTALLYVLTPQSAQTLAPAPENVPAPQDVHELSNGAPVAAENFPAAHCEQVLAADAPVAAEYRPTPQSAQTLALVAPVADEYLPAPQSVHDGVPVTVLYFPGVHALHVSPLTPVYPLFQAQLVAAGAPLGECEFAGQEPHVLSAVLPTAAEYFPAPQSMQALTPAAAEYLPAPQSLHDGVPATIQYFPGPHCVHVFALPVSGLITVVHPTAQVVHAVTPAAEMDPTSHLSQPIK